MPAFAMKKLPLGFWLKSCTHSYDLLGMGDMLWASSKIESGGARNFKASLLMLNPASSKSVTLRLRRNINSSSANPLNYSIRSSNSLRSVNEASLVRLLHKAVCFCYRRGVGFRSRVDAGSHTTAWFVQGTKRRPREEAAEGRFR